MVRPVTNHDLDALLVEAGYDGSHAAFARQINLAGRARGAYRYDGPSVYWWLRGRRPDPPVQALIADVLSRKLGRPVPVGDLGFDGTDAWLGLTYPAAVSEPVDTVTDLWRVLVYRRELMAPVPFVVAAAVDAGFGWRYDPRDADVSRPRGRRVTAADVAALQRWVEQFVDLDRRHGGGGEYTRTLMADVLHRQITPMLHGSYTDRVGRDLLATAAALTGQVAFMSYDAGEQHVPSAIS